MTSIVLYRHKGKLTGFEANSHTGYAEEGHDIVCSAVSALTQSAILGLEGVANIAVRYEIAEANLQCSIPEDLDPAARERADMVLETMALGLESIRQGYQEYLDMTQREV